MNIDPAKTVVTHNNDHGVVVKAFSFQNPQKIPVNKRADLLLKVLTDSLFRPRKNELIIRNSKYLQIDFETHDFDQTSNKIHIYCNGDKAFEIKIRKNERLNVIKLYAKKTL